MTPLPPDDPESALAAFTVPGVAEAISNEIDQQLGDAGSLGGHVEAPGCLAKAGSSRRSAATTCGRR